MARYSYDGTRLDVAPDDITAAEIATRDIDRGDSPHFFLKEILEAPRSFRTTLRGRIERVESPAGSARAPRARAPRARAPRAR
ncbi:MAG TPA: hypothetical protein DEP69_02395, partial [Acidimicrobiaceae bacterium]|nr:hypothetical protein [Acidimicrobiaceae bacterium]